MREHISSLEQKILDLNQQMMEGRRTLLERNRIASDIRAAELALAYYRAALHVEGRLS